MSKSLHSPTARLLQSSRLFSLPRPLPAPLQQAPSASASFKASETATLPYPTHQAIATPASSHFRGDWGLKRPIPRKTTARSSTPVIRVRAQDNTQHITDFESAADHVLTEAKWRQMGIPITKQEARTSYSGNRAGYRSVYDEDLDHTDPEATSLDASQLTAGRLSARGEGSKQRWKFDGPWLAGMEEGEFEVYVSEKLSKRKAEFKRFLANRMLDKRIRDEERVNRERGAGGALLVARVEQLRKYVEENYESEEKKLRDDHVHQQLGSALTSAICDFLDLPSVDMGRQNYAQSTMLQAQLDSLTSTRGPPSTHPGAGLSHIRTNAFIENHPYWGPQMYHAPVKARVLSPRLGFLSNQHYALLGVGGVVTRDPIGSGANVDSRSAVPEYSESEKEEYYNHPDRMVSSLNENLTGGNKIWVHPQTAHIDEAGRIELQISRADKEAIAVKRNKVQPIRDAKSQDYFPTTPGYVGGAPPGQEPNYGHSLPDMRRMRASGVEGFDKEMGMSARQGQMDQAQVAQKIRQLMGGRGATASPSSRFQ
ncbi:hypothetical protein CERZMDRAFT_92111 [Cercospora zeae-maydis SCOH1-5]|uniref:Uncharacterized protein n=1 Tax=Cercospora zeae-maydis SCOH1-5 TaxID=717836 RepID=A0A6A6FVU1_9PEZI|nr:hypothetical protein CERZMDRAFT_92111 [Cercospora zeae-maydis SCOH1-5]